MDQNPYAPPKAPVSDVATGDGKPVVSDLPLYSVAQITLATFLASGFAGAWLISANYRAIGQSNAARRSLWIGAGATIATIAFGVLLPQNFPPIILPMGVAIGTRTLAERLFGVILKEHEAGGGERRSWWSVVGISVIAIGILCLVVLTGLFAWFLVTGDSL